MLTNGEKNVNRYTSANYAEKFLYFLCVMTVIRWKIPLSARKTGCFRRQETALRRWERKGRFLYK